MSAVLLTPPGLQFFDNNGDPLAGGKLYSYVAGTTTPKVTYTDETANTPAPNPIILDAAGRATVWIAGSYSFVLTDANGVVITTTDNVTAFTVTDASNTAYFQTFSGNGSTKTFTLSQNLGTDENSIYVWVDSGGNTNVTDTPFFQAINSIALQTVFTVSQDLGTDPNAIQVFINTSAKGYDVLRPTTDYTISGTTLTLTVAPGAFTPGVLVFKNPVLSTTAIGKGYQIQNPSAYTLSSTSITFASAPAAGTNNIYVSAPSSLLGTASAYADAAQSSANDANTAASAASVSQIAAAASASAASTSASNASTSASAAATSASNASTSASTATTQASAASTSASAASTSATNAAASAVLAAATLNSTSTTSNTIGTGSKSFTTQTNKNYTTGQYISAANGANIMYGNVTSYDTTTGALVINVTTVVGSGTFAAWTIGVNGSPGASGGGTGTVTSVSVVSTNGLAGSVANPTTTPAITLSTSVTGLLKGNGTAISAAIAGTDYQAAGSYITALTSDVTASGPGSSAATIANNAVTNAKAAQMAAHTFKGNNTGSTANALDLTATQLTAELNVLVGDSGSGGTKGLVPAPSAGDAAAGKVLGAGGGWVASGSKLVLIDSQTASNSAALNFTSGITSAYSKIIFVFDNIVLGGTAALWAQVSINTGSTYITANASYIWGFEKQTAAAPPVQSFSGGVTGAAAAEIVLADLGTRFFGEFTMYDPAATVAKRCDSTIRGIDQFYGFSSPNTTSPIDAVRFLASTGNIASGTIYLYGFKNT